MPADHPFNRVLAALTQGDHLPWTEQLEQVELPARHELHPQGASALHVHFPTSALVVLTQSSAIGSEAPVALVGNDGVLGLAALMGTGPETSRAVVVHPGSAWRLPITALHTGGPKATQVVKAAVGHLFSLASQISQTAYCQQNHNLEQRLSRWLLTALDRLPGHGVAIDQKALAPLLGVSVEALAPAVQRLAAVGALACEPGRLVVPDRSLLQTHSCGCHAPAQGTPGADSSPPH